MRFTPHYSSSDTVPRTRLQTAVSLGRRSLLGLTLAGLLAFAPQALGSQAAAAVQVLIMGDSISAEYGLSRGSGWIAHLQGLAGQRAQLINASISGETTAGGRTRLPALLSKHQPDIVIIELGGNDALRGLRLNASAQNIDAMINASLGAGAQVLILGMQVPPNYGRRYTERFAGMYAELAKRHATAIVPFLLEQIASDDSFFQADRIHPNEKAQPSIAKAVWAALAPMLPN